MTDALVSIGIVSVAATAAVFDLRSRRIPNLLTLPALVLALGLRGLMGGEAFVAGLAGAGIALAVGLLFFAVGAFGGGDGKLMMAMGAFLGVDLLLSAFVLMALSGGVLALIEMVRSRTVIITLFNVHQMLMHRSGAGVSLRNVDRGGVMTVPYGVAIAIGAVGARFFA